MEFIQQHDYTDEETRDFNTLVCLLYKWAKLTGKGSMEATAYYFISRDVLTQDAYDEDSEDSETSRSFGGEWDYEMDADDLTTENDSEWGLFKTRADFELVAPLPDYASMEKDKPHDKKKAGKFMNRFGDITSDMLKEHGTIDSVVIIMEAIRTAKTIKSSKALKPFLD